MVLYLSHCVVVEGAELQQLTREALDLSLMKKMKLSDQLGQVNIQLPYKGIFETGGKNDLIVSSWSTGQGMWLIDWFLVFNATFSKYFSYIMAISFSGGRS